jgi:hypothetical protein
MEPTPFNRNTWNTLVHDHIEVLFLEQRGALTIRMETKEGEVRLWTAEEIYNLLNDGMKFRSLRKAEKIRKELSNDVE